MSAIDQPVLTVTGIRKSEGNFSSEGKNIDFSNTVVTVLQPFTEEEIASGAIGMKSTEYKIKGAQFYHDYQGQKLPAGALQISCGSVSGFGFYRFKKGIRNKALTI